MPETFIPVNGDSGNSAPVTGGFIPLNGDAGNSAPVGGRRHMKKVSAKTIKRTLKKLGMKPKGRVVIKGGEMEEMAVPGAPAPAPASAGKRGKKKTQKKRSASRRHSGIFGL